MNDRRPKFNDWHAFCTKVLSEADPGKSLPSAVIDNQSEFVRYLKSNGIASSVLELLEKHDQNTLLPEQVIAELKSFRRHSSVLELYKRQNIQNTLDLLQSHQIDCLILKGTALAYSIYQRPYQRVRADTDLLISQADKQAVDQCLLEYGYQKSNTISGEFVSHQCSYWITDNEISHCYDIHWKISNRNAFANLFDFEELYRCREPLNELAGNAYRLSNIDALLHAVIHYYGHFPYDRERLIWVYDLHLLCCRITPGEWTALLKKSAEKNLNPMIQQALQLTRKTFNTQLPDDVLQVLGNTGAGLDKIESRRLSSSHWSRIEQFKSDWNALSAAQRCRLLKEYLIPPGEFILRQNDSSNRLLLPYFYLKRILSGVYKLFKNSIAR